MRIELSLSTFDATTESLRRAAARAEELGIGGLWVMDHLSGRVHATRHHVLECLSTLSMVTEATERARVGTLVLNPAARQPVVAAQALATIAEASAGRLWVGLGAGGGSGTYGDELAWAGLVNHPAAERRSRLAETIAVFRHVWRGDTDAHPGPAFPFEGGPGFLTPSPVPPVFVAGYGPKMAELAAGTAGFNTIASHPNLEALVTHVRRTRASVDGSAVPRPRSTPFEISVYAVADDCWFDPDSPERRRLDGLGIDTLIVVIPAPFDDGLLHAATR